MAIAYTDLPSDARVLREARETARAGGRVTLLAPSPGATSGWTPPEGCEVVWLDAPQERGQTTIRGQRRFMREVARWTRDQAALPAVVHVHNMPDYLIWSVRHWQHRGVRLVLDVHDVMSDLARHRFRGFKGVIGSRLLAFAERWAWRRADHILTVHEYYRELILQAGIPRRKVSTVLNVPDEHQAALLRRRPPPAQLFKIVFHGTVSERTGVLSAIRALPAVLKQVPQAQLWIVGTGNARARVRSEIEQLGLGDRVVFTDAYYPLAEAIALISDAHVAIVPPERSSYNDGILPVKLLEYLTMGIPTVATRLPLIARYVPSEAVSLVDTPTPERLAAALIELATDSGRYRQLESAMAGALAALTWSNFRPTFRRALSLEAAVS